MTAATDATDACATPSMSKVKPKKTEIIDGFTIKYHANGVTRWSKGKTENGDAAGYWEWYRPDGTLKRSGHFEAGEPVGEWITYDQQGQIYKVTQRKNASADADAEQSHGE